MENLNKLSFKNYKVNEDKIMVPMENIVQEYDIPEHAKLYLFKLIYVHKFHSPTNTFTCYLSPLADKDMPIVKAQIPLELIYTHKIIPGYSYNRNLEDNELYIIKEKVFRMINEINCGHINYFLICYGYLINKYKDDDANTKLTRGIQMFNFTSCGRKLLHDRNYETYYIFGNKLDRLMKIALMEKDASLRYRRNREILKEKASCLIREVSFKDIPEGFLTEK